MSTPERPIVAPTWATDDTLASGPASGHVTKIEPAGWPDVVKGFTPGGGISGQVMNQLLNNLFAWAQHLKDAQGLNWTTGIAEADLDSTNFKARCLGQNVTDGLVFCGSAGLKLRYALADCSNWVDVTPPMGGSSWPINFIADDGADKTMLLAENDGAGNWDTYLYEAGAVALKSANSKANAIPYCLTITSSGRWIVGGKTTGPISAIWYSDDDGANWTEVALPDADTEHRPVYAIACKAGRIVALGGLGGTEPTTAWVSTDDGETWVEHLDITSGVFLYTGTREARLSYSAALELFMTIGQKGEVYTSPDGVTWTARATIALTNGSSGNWLANNGGAWITAFREASIGLDQNNDRMPLFYSADAGVTWRPVGEAPAGDDELLRAMVPIPGGFAAVSSDLTAGTMSVGRSILL